MADDRDLGTGGAALALRRRGLLRAAAAAGLGLAAAPATLRHGRASSGEVSVFAWGDYADTFAKGGLKAKFEAASGIKLNLATFGSNEELQNKLKAAGGKGFDVIFPSVDTGPIFYADELLAPIDESRVAVAQIIPAMWRSSLRLGAAHRGRRYLIPFDWGTEAITWNATRHPELEYGAISYGDLFRPGARAAVRQKSVLVSLALHLDATGEVKSDRGMDLVKSEADCRRVLEATTRHAIAHKAAIGAFWNNATEATAAFTDAGCTIGQTWDTTGILLNRTKGADWRYTMPVEGGLAWMDTCAIPAGAANVEQAYAFINFMLTPEAGAIFSNMTGYNTAAVGAEPFLSEESRAAFAMAYPDQAAIDNLWWWPMQTDFFARLRGEFVEKLTNA